MRILLIGHGCAPESGSEPGSTWNWAAHLAKANDVWVITHAYFQPQIERYLAHTPIPRLRFVYTGRLGWWDPLRLPSSRWIRLHYVAWQRRVMRLAAELDAVHDFDLMHHVGWGTVSAPPRLWRLDKPFIWGPLGGGQTTPWRLLSSFGRAIPSELLRTLRVSLMPMTPAVRRAASRAAAVFSANHETTSVLRQAGAAAPRLFADVGVPRHLLQDPPPPRPKAGPFVVLWAGRIEARKGIGLCLDVARRVAAPDVRFVIAGDGPLAKAAQRQAERLRLRDRVTFLGPRPWPELQTLHRSAHVFLFTSVRDTFGNVVPEALAGGAPVICIDHQGVGAHLTAEAAMKVPVGWPAQVAAAMAHVIDNLAADRERLSEMSAAARRHAEDFAWDRRSDAMQAHYATAIAAWRERRGRAGACMPTGHVVASSALAAGGVGAPPK
ncbi:glycosyltransferase family 4 protein [Falsiroseomonas oryzae]|uniref:glycosyltransferase family 4 protein n=1 Tax=Falsiroseomonas oryzae TaxID=2766473 RepID=UPI0022EB0DA9|nr:glycosyltransferase [Roseomonas sp. MO-31]